MTLTLYFHPLASYCHKVLIALYESGTKFETHVVDFGDAAATTRFKALWPIGKIPVLRDESRGRTVPETTIIIEYLQQHYPGPRPLLPADADARLEARHWDRFFDLYVSGPMQTIVGDHFRPDGAKDAQGVAAAIATLKTAYGMIDRQMADRRWAIGEDFSIADCAAASALFFVETLLPFSKTHPNLAAYFERLVDRPSFARVLAEAKPYFHFYPFQDRIAARFR
jgi:glutathione S-transferase